jgi:arsenate reductase
METKKILVLCTGNSCRSQMAEAYFRYFAGQKAEVYSAGVETHGINPLAAKTLLDDGIDISAHTSNHVDEYLDIPFDYIITVCDHANEVCPIIPGNAKRFHQNFHDPSKSVGTKEEIDEEFKKARNQIKEYCRAFVNTYL